MWNNNDDCLFNLWIQATHHFPAKDFFEDEFVQTHAGKVLHF